MFARAVAEDMNDGRPPDDLVEGLAEIASGSPAARCRWWRGYPFRQLAQGRGAFGTDWRWPVCGNPPHLNPFVIEADWRPLTTQHDNTGEGKETQTAA